MIMLYTNHFSRIAIAIALFLFVALYKGNVAEAASTKAQYSHNGETVVIECELIKKGRLRYPPRAKR